MSNSDSVTTETKPIIDQMKTQMIFGLGSSEQTDKILDAFAKAQAEFPVIPKNQEVEVKKEGRLLYKFKYADLTTIIDHTRPHLTKNGLSFTQDFSFHIKLGPGFLTTLFHSTGQWMKLAFVPCQINPRMSMKEVAGLYTYGKRISLSAALGVSGDEDMDAAPVDASLGNSTEKPRQTQKQNKSSQQSKQSQNPKTQNQRQPDDIPPPDDGNYSEPEPNPFDYEPEPELTPMQQITAIAKRKNLVQKMPEIIKRVTGGRASSSKELNDDEVQSLLKYMRLQDGNKNQS